MSDDLPLSKWLLYPLAGLFFLGIGFSGYWLYAPVDRWNACGLSGDRLSFRKVEPAEATLVVVIHEEKTNTTWTQYWAVQNTSADTTLKLHAAVGANKSIFGLQIPHQRRAIIVHLRSGRDEHRSLKSFTYDVKWITGNTDACLPSSIINNTL